MVVGPKGFPQTQARILMIIVALVVLGAGVPGWDLALGMRQIRGMSSSWQGANKTTVMTLQRVIAMGSSPASREGVLRCI